MSEFQENVAIDTNIVQITSLETSKGNNSIEDSRVIYDMLVNADGKISYEKFSVWFNSYSKKRKSSVQEDGSSNRKVKKTTVNVGSNITTLVAPSISSSLSSARKTALLKSLVTSLKASIKTKKFYQHGSTEECAAEAVLNESEFVALFGSIGSIPLGAKESNVVTIKSLTDVEVKSLFGALVNGIKTQTFSNPRSFQKQYKTGSEELSVGRAHVTYSKNTSLCKIKFSVNNEGTGGSMWGY